MFIIKKKKTYIELQCRKRCSKKSYATHYSGTNVSAGFWVDVGFWAVQSRYCCLLQRGGFFFNCNRDWIRPWDRCFSDGNVHNLEFSLKKVSYFNNGKRTFLNTCSCSVFILKKLKKVLNCSLCQPEKQAFFLSF